MRQLAIVLGVCSLALLGGCPFNPFFPDDSARKDAVVHWNRIAIDASGLDHTPPAAGETRRFGEQIGPVLSARAMAIVHIAMFDAFNAIEGGYESYTRTPAVTDETSAEAALAQAAHDTLIALFPAQKAAIDAELSHALDGVHAGRAKTNGIALGAETASRILAMRDGDGSDTPEPYTVSDEPGAWRPDPINPAQQPLGEEYRNIKPFVLNSASQFRAPPPPALDSAQYASAFDEVKRLGGDGIVTPTERTSDETQAGLYWAYDGTPSLCAPPRLYNQIAVNIATDQSLTSMELMRLLALVNVSMADAGIAIWESKYHYNFWRPVTGIREADVGTGPTGLGDGNAATVGDGSFTPLCAPASNLVNANNFTPPFPAYPSGHAGFGGALFETLRKFFGTDDIAFTFVSDEYNGVTRDNLGNTRPLLPRSFATLSEAEEENGQSRIYLGIHWRFDKVEGIAQGNHVADHVMEYAFQPLY